MPLRILFFTLLAAVALLVAPLSAPYAQDEAAKPENAEGGKDKPSKEKGEKDKGDKDKDKPKVFTSEFSGTFGGERLTYKVTAGETFLKNDKGEDTAAIFTVAYTKKDVADARTRPVTFVFNGGPGSASLWLHMGVFGPKRVIVPSDGKPAGAAPYRIEDNPLSVLDATDLVFIDPVGTGYSVSFAKFSAV